MRSLNIITQTSHLNSSQKRTRSPERCMKWWDDFATSGPASFFLQGHTVRRAELSYRVRLQKLVFYLEPALFVVHQQLQVVLPFGLAVIPNLKYGLHGVGMSFMDPQHLSSVPHLRFVIFLVQMVDLLSHQVWIVEPHGAMCSLHSWAQYPPPPVFGAVAGGQVGAVLDFQEWTLLFQRTAA